MLRRLGVFLLATLPMVPTRAADPPRPARDFEGRPFVTGTAPVLTFRPRTAPAPGGIDYPFAEQTARGVALFERFPEFTLSDRRIHMSGPWYAPMAANGHLLRGATSIEAMPMYRQEPNDIRALPPDRKWQLLGDGLFWAAAGDLASKLRTAAPKDPRIPALRRLHDKHEMSPDEDAFRELGRYFWHREAAPPDAQSRGVLYAMIDIELTGGFEHQRSCIGSLYRGMSEAAAERGCRVVPVTYANWTYVVGAVEQSMRQGGSGPPEFFLPDRDPLAAPDALLSVCNDLHGVVSMDGYVQNIWGREPFYKRNADGSMALVDGRPVFNELEKTTLYGREFRLEKGEAERCLRDIYRQAVRMYLMHHHLAGQYPAHSGLRKPFLENVRVGAWTRVTNEGVLETVQNDRPLPGWLLELVTGLYLVTADDVVAWGVETNRPARPLGSDYTDAWTYASHGMYEFLIKAAHRYSALDPIHHGPFRWCWFNLPMINKNRTEGDFYYQKPLAIGKIRTYQGRPWLEFFAAYPAIDGQPTEMTLWVDNGGRRSEPYSIRLADGRSYFYDAWQLPGEFRDIEGKHVWLRFIDPLGQSHTWRGDWREVAEKK